MSSRFVSYVVGLLVATSIILMASTYVAKFFQG